MLAALPVPRSSSEVIKPSELFLDLMMLDPLKKETSPTAVRSKSTSATMGKPVQRPGGAAAQPDTSAKVVELAPQDTKGVFDWSPPSLPMQQATAASSMPVYSTAWPQTKDLPPAPAGFSPLPLANFRMAQPIRQSAGAMPMRDASPTSSPTQALAPMGASYSLKLPPASRPSLQVSQTNPFLQNLNTPLLGSSVPVTSVTPLGRTDWASAAQPRPMASRSVAVPAQPLVPGAWSAPSTVGPQFRQIPLPAGAALPYGQGGYMWPPSSAPAHAATSGAAVQPHSVLLPSQARAVPKSAAVPPASAQVTAPQAGTQLSASQAGAQGTAPVTAAQVHAGPPAVGAPRVSAAPLPAYPWSSRPCQACPAYQAAKPAVAPSHLQRASLPTPQVSQPLRLVTTTQIPSAARPMMTQVPYHYASGLQPRLIQTPGPGLGAAEVAQMAAARFPLP